MIKIYASMPCLHSIYFNGGEPVPYNTLGAWNCILTSGTINLKTQGAGWKEVFNFNFNSHTGVLSFYNRQEMIEGSGVYVDRLTTFLHTLNGFTVIGDEGEPTKNLYAVRKMYQVGNVLAVISTAGHQRMFRINKLESHFELDVW